MLYEVITGTCDTIKRILIELHELLGSVYVREQTSERLERCGMLGHGGEGALVLVYRFFDGAELRFVDLRSASVRVCSPLCA